MKPAGPARYEAALKLAQSIHREWMDDVATYQLIAEGHLGLDDYSTAESDISMDARSP
jgi:hypothetical protein